MTDSRIYLPDHADQARRQAARRANGTMPPSQWETRDAERANAHARNVSYAKGALISADCELDRAHHDNFVAAARLARALVDHGNAFDAYVAALDSTDAN